MGRASRSEMSLPVNLQSASNGEERRKQERKRQEMRRQERRKNKKRRQ